MADATEQQGLLSIIRDTTSRTALEKYMLAHGVDPIALHTSLPVKPSKPDKANSRDESMGRRRVEGAGSG